MLEFNSRIPRPKFAYMVGHRKRKPTEKATNPPSDHFSDLETDNATLLPKPSKKARHGKAATTTATRKLSTTKKTPAAASKKKAILDVTLDSDDELPPQREADGGDSGIK